jgi:hypothetical protein
MLSAAIPSTYASRLADALTRRRYDSAIKPLSTVLSFQDLIDANFCKTVSQELAKDGRAWEVHRATPALWEQIKSLPRSQAARCFPWPPAKIGTSQRIESGTVEPIANNSR